MNCETVSSLFWGYTAFFVLLALYGVRMMLKLNRLADRLHAQMHSTVEQGTDEQQS